jgi:hypothetical protein
MHNNPEIILYMISQAIILLFVFYTGFEKITSKYVANIHKFVTGVILFLALLISIRLTTYLPFLGYAAFPTTAIKDILVPEKANVNVTLPFMNIPDNTKIVYWGAKTASKTVANPQTAYADFSNCGVALIRNNKADISFNCPAKYVVPWGETLDRHIHYRIIYADGIIGPVQTVYVKC